MGPFRAENLATNAAAFDLLSLSLILCNSLQSPLYEQWLSEKDPE